MIVFQTGWNSGSNDNAPHALGEDKLKEAIIAVMKKLPAKTNDEEFNYLVTMGLSDAQLAKAKVVK